MFLLIDKRTWKLTSLLILACLMFYMYRIATAQPSDRSEWIQSITILLVGVTIIYLAGVLKTYAEHRIEQSEKDRRRYKKIR